MSRTGPYLLHALPYLIHVCTLQTDYDWGQQCSVRRSIFMGDFVYALGVGGVTATNLATMAQTAVVEFPIPSSGPP